MGPNGTPAPLERPKGEEGPGAARGDRLQKRAGGPNEVPPARLSIKSINFRTVSAVGQSSGVNVMAMLLFFGHDPEKRGWALLLCCRAVPARGQGHACSRVLPGGLSKGGLRGRGFNGREAACPGISPLPLTALDTVTHLHTAWVNRLVKMAFMHGVSLPELNRSHCGGLSGGAGGYSPRRRPTRNTASGFRPATWPGS